MQSSSSPIDQRDIQWYQRRVDELERKLVLTQKVVHELETNHHSSSRHRHHHHHHHHSSSTPSSSSSSSRRGSRPSTASSGTTTTTTNNTNNTSGGQRLVGDIRARSPAERQHYAQKGLDAIEELKNEYARVARERHNDVHACAKFLSSKARDFEATVVRLHDKHDRAQEQLRVETEERMRLLIEEFEVQQGPHKLALATMSTYLRDLVDQKFLRIMPPSVLHDPSQQQQQQQVNTVESAAAAGGGGGDDDIDDSTNKTKKLHTSPAGSSDNSEDTNDDGDDNNNNNKQAAMPIAPGTSPLSARPIWSEVVGGGGGGGRVSSPATVTGSPLRLHMSPAIRFATPPTAQQHHQQQQQQRRNDSADDDDDSRDAMTTAEQRRRVASESLKPMFPHMSVDECIRALAQHGDNVEQTMLELLKLECEQPPVPAPSQPPTTTKPLLPSPNTSNKPAQVVQRFRPPSSLRILVRVVKVHANADIEFQVVVDRNGMPIDSRIAPPHIVPASALFHELDARLVTDDERARAHAFMNAVTPVITFQPLGSAGFRPVSVMPALPLKEYRIDYDPVAEEIVAVYQVDDGPIIFTAYNPFKLPVSTVPVRSHFSSIAEVYTQKYDQRLSLAHIHLPDDTHTGSIRIRLHHDTGATPIDEMVFDVNTLNVCLTDDKVTALVRHDAIGGVKKLFFIEYRIPEPGVLVTLEDMDMEDDESQSEGLCLARVGRCHGTVDVQTRVSPGGGGLALSSSSDDSGDEDEAGVPPQGFSQRSRRLSFENEVCGRKHTMSGLVEVVVMLEFGQVLQNPRKETTPVCRIREARSWEAQVLGIVS